MAKNNLTIEDLPNYRPDLRIIKNCRDCFYAVDLTPDVYCIYFGWHKKIKIDSDHKCDYFKLKV